MQTPQAQYEQDLHNGTLKPDPAQARAIAELNRLYFALIEGSKSRLFSFKRARAPKGVYLYGGVGRGKTYMMDLFYHALPLKQKMRMHFNRFMESVHKHLNTFQGQKDPLQKVAARVAKQTKVICFDEFIVEDIADAMVLGQLFTELFALGVCLVATSNRAPDDLYKDGLKRDRFLPAIAQIKQNTQVLNVDSGIDYRVLGDAAQVHLGCQDLAEAFDAACQDEPLCDRALIINNRKIEAVKACSRAVWFEFQVICTSPRSKADYIVLADRYKAVCVSNVPQMDESTDDQCRRFIALVDELYDNDVSLYLSADVPIEQLYVGHKYAFAFQRTLSRLLSR